jgi:hypothetical protein
MNWNQLVAVDIADLAIGWPGGAKHCVCAMQWAAHIADETRMIRHLVAAPLTVLKSRANTPVRVSAGRAGIVRGRRVEELNNDRANRRSG